MPTFFKSNYITIDYDKINHVIIHTWLVPPSSDEFREGLNSLIPAMEHFKTGKIITDTTHMGIIHSDDQKWAVTDWRQRALKVGYSRLGIIIPADVFTRMSMEETIGRTVNQVPIAYFENTEDATYWIK